MSLQKIPNDVLITGSLQVQGPVSFGAGTIGDSQVAATAGISATKLTHDHIEKYSQPNTTATTETRGLYVARNSGTVVEVSAGSIAANVGAATVTVDLKKNGVSILSAVITLDNANTARVVEMGTISGASYVAGDFFEIVITATAGGGTLATGVYIQALFREVGAA